jgi:hypothetical protein
VVGQLRPRRSGRGWDVAGGDGREGEMAERGEMAEASSATTNNGGSAARVLIRTNMNGTLVGGRAGQVT